MRGWNSSELKTRKEERRRKLKPVPGKFSQFSIQIKSNGQTSNMKPTFLNVLLPFTFGNQSRMEYFKSFLVALLECVPWVMSGLKCISMQATALFLLLQTLKNVLLSNIIIFRFKLNVAIEKLLQFMHLSALKISFVTSTWKSVSN